MSGTKQLFLFSLFLFSGGILLYSQEKAVNRAKYRINISRTREEMKIDGILDEKSWQDSEKAENFIRVTPVDTGFAVSQTTVLITYDKTKLYVGAIGYAPNPGNDLLSSSKGFRVWQK
jgi:hypothetical protein